MRDGTSTAGQVGLLPRPLDKWFAAAQMDGTIRLRRAQVARGKEAIVFALLFALLLWILTSPRVRAEMPIPVQIFLLALGVVFGGGFVWLMVGREEWTVGSDQLEVRRRVLGLSWRRAYAGASLHVSYFLQPGYYSACDSWHLWVCPPGKRKRLLHTVALVPDESVALGQWLAQQTGWPLDLSGA
jgi:hypothetical protein